MFTIAIHGGAGVIRRDRYSEAELAEYEASLRACLAAGARILQAGGKALDAVTESVRALEDCPLFNAGRGSVLSADEKVQMDASLMCGATGNGGGITLVERIRNPILAARAVMEKTPHTLLGGPDAEKWAQAQGLAMADPAYFVVPKRLEQLREAKEKKKIELDHSGGGPTEIPDSNTVGAVALDSRGNLAAATSTGGLTNKLSGRISDSSILGAGTFASNATLAISGTGTGDIFIRNVLCHDVHALMLYRQSGLEAACREALEKLAAAGGEGGLIALTRSGELCLPFNTPGMFRAFQREGGAVQVGIFGD
jgi:L-asparaginase / beta-aspartyl-peptidase